MRPLKKNPTLRNLQDYIQDVGKERGWNRDSVLEKFLLFIEEIGELAKEIRKQLGLYAEKGKKGRKRSKKHLGHESVDVFNYLIDIVNHYHIDLEKAFRDKDRINQKRKWK